jgi:hypothetical protein
MRIVDVSGESVTVSADGEVRRLRTADIRRIRARRSDSVLNGALIGAGAGIASGLFMCRLTEPWEICNDPGPLFGVGAIGAGAGIAIDALIRGRRTIYETPRGARLHVAPLIGRHARGLQISVVF